MGGYSAFAVGRAKKVTAGWTDAKMRCIEDKLDKKEMVN